jgi:hypothetical protein
MDKPRYFIFCLFALFVASASPQAEAQFSYAKNTFIVYNGCLGIYPGTSLRLGERVSTFSWEHSPGVSKVVQVIPAMEAKTRFDAVGNITKVSKDRQLWAEIGCVFWFRGDLPELLAQVTDPDNSLGVGLAIRGLPAGAWTSEGKGESVAMEVAGNPYVGLVRHLVTDDCYGPDSSIRVRQFPVRKGHTIVQLDIGKITKLSPEKRRLKIEQEMRDAENIYAKWAWPKYKKIEMERLEKKGFVESVQICRFFLDGKRVLREEKISRRTGVQERVDTATDLDTDNWADTTKSAIGFVSLNEGKDWDALFVDVGWEGINYDIERLDGSVVQYSRYLYTYH